MGPSSFGRGGGECTAHHERHAEASILVARHHRATLAKRQLGNTPPSDPKVKRANWRQSPPRVMRATRRMYQGHQWLVMQVAGEYLAGGLNSPCYTGWRTGGKGLLRAIANLSSHALLWV